MMTAAQQIGAYKRMSEIKPTEYDEALLLSLIETAERRSEQRVRAEIGRALDKACETVMGIETPAMEGDNLAVTLCSHFEDCEGEADDNGWHPKAVEGYEQVKSAIAQHFRSAADAAREVG